MFLFLRTRLRHIFALSLLGLITPVLRAQESAVIDVLILYTGSVDNEYEGRDGVLAYANGLIASANTAFTNSGLSMQLRLSDIVEVDYRYSSNVDTMITHLETPSDGYLDEAQALREANGADLVCLLSIVTDRYYAGVADLLDVNGGDDSYIYSVVDASSSASWDTFAHEIGHNLGGAHDYDNAYGSGLFPYSHGFRFTGNDGVLYRTIMAYQPGYGIPYFSNPGVHYQGVSAGVPERNPNPANNAATFIRTMPWVANYRQDRVIYLDDANRLLDKEAQSYTLNFYARGAWHVESKPDWVTVTPSSGNGGGDVSLAVSVSAQTFLHERNGTIVINGKEHVIIQQGDWQRGVNPDGNLSFTREGEGHWYMDNAESGHGYALHNDSSTLGEAWIETIITGPGILSYWRYLNYPMDYNILIDDNLLESGKGSSDWWYSEFAIPEGEHVIRWEASNLHHGGWLRMALSQISFSEKGNFDHSALSTSGLEFLRNGPDPWHFQNRSSRPNRNSSITSTSANNTWNQLSSVVKGPGILSYWKICSYPNYGTCSLLLDGREIEDFTNSLLWNKSSFRIPDGNHTITWQIKGATVYLDEIEFISDNSFDDILLSPSGLQFTLGGNALWRMQSSTTRTVGKPSAYCGFPAKYSSTWIETTVDGPGVLSYWRKHEMTIESDGAMIDYIDPNDNDWVENSVYLPKGQKTIRWTYWRNNKGAYLDDIIFIPETPFDDSALSPSGLTFSQSGGAPWRVQSDFTRPNRPTAIRCIPFGKIDYNGSKLTTTLTGPGTLTFWCCVQTTNDETLNIGMDGLGIPNTLPYENSSWQKKTINIPSGQHTFNWRFNPSYYVEHTDIDGAYLDEVEFTPADTFADYYLTQSATPLEGTTGNGWYWSYWFGSFFINERDWIYHQDYGWVYANAAGNSEGGAWLYIANKASWFWFSNALAIGTAFDTSQGSFAFYDSVTDAWWPF